jgi:hypothetical protein
MPAIQPWQWRTPRPRRPWELLLRYCAVLPWHELLIFAGCSGLVYASVVIGGVR